MATVLLVIHLLVTATLIGVVLLQRSEGGGLGVGSSQGMGSFMSGRGTANLLTRTTGILGAAFFVLSIALALLNRGSGPARSILDGPPPPGVGSPAVPPVLPATPAAPGNAAPATPAPTTPPATTAAPAVPTN